MNPPATTVSGISAPTREAVGLLIAAAEDLEEVATEPEILTALQQLTTPLAEMVNAMREHADQFDAGGPAPTTRQRARPAHSDEHMRA